ncbi:MAG: flippase-like domain-containing protein [Phycisphaeraceae bacterium]|nr:flippase-like domain-containing protein [Phycisphaeraceae bacterium]
MASSESSPIKRYLSLALRILLTAAGIAFIVWNVDWVDRIEVRPGASRFPNISQPILMRVVGGAVDPQHQAEPLILETDGLTPTQITLSPTELSDTDHYLLRPSFITTVRHADRSLLFLGLLLVAPVYPAQAYRWLILMKARGLEVSYGQALKLTMIGAFFNYCMPGSTGGDVVKAFYAARRKERRTEAVMSVVFDRIAGMVGLVLLAGVVSLFILHEPLAKRISQNLWIGAAVLTLTAAFYFSRRIRRALGVDRLISKLPGQNLLTKLDAAALAYADHKGAVLASMGLSVPIHFALASAAAVAGYAMGMDRAVAGFGLLLTVIPIIFLAGSLPITPQGAGVWEAIGKQMLDHPPQVTMNQIVAMLLMIRLYHLVYSLTGSVFLLRGDVHLHPERDEESAEPSQPQRDPLTR